MGTEEGQGHVEVTDEQSHSPQSPKSAASSSSLTLNEKVKNISDHKDDIPAQIITEKAVNDTGQKISPCKSVEEQISGQIHSTSQTAEKETDQSNKSDTLPKPSPRLTKENNLNNNLSHVTSQTSKNIPQNVPNEENNVKNNQIADEIGAGDAHVMSPVKCVRAKADTGTDLTTQRKSVSDLKTTDSVPAEFKSADSGFHSNSSASVIRAQDGLVASPGVKKPSSSPSPELNVTGSSEESCTLNDSNESEKTAGEDVVEVNSYVADDSIMEDDVDECGNQSQKSISNGDYNRSVVEHNFKNKVMGHVFNDNFTSTPARTFSQSPILKSQRSVNISEGSFSGKIRHRDGTKLGE